MYRKNSIIICTISAIITPLKERVHHAYYTVSSRFAESHFAECLVRFSFHNFYFKFLSLM